MFFSANNALGPPYHILLDTNFINFRHGLLRIFRLAPNDFTLRSIQNKLDVMQAAMDCLYAKCTIYIRCVCVCYIYMLYTSGVYALYHV
jgi:U3 small nucleolar RNA-associated protein 24